ncbi:hypothetical protein CR152_06950 [Massilia violaceinigra]|uniref:Uncharacterized protein n=1 Tax=Massilia violaceinigra TaxID=2045208 RepID=A0A2D2DH24_9BURK|nr:hypothetical protein [Massilia violaceinigra]ATQ74270.1 hypothetical protein CR152_06950 [Massilia violaceinigra]
MGLFGFGKKPLPMDRYAGKPFLKLVDSFVLKCIDELDPSQEALLVAMTPKFRESFSTAGSWGDIVIDQLHFPVDIRDSINVMWTRNQEIAKQGGTTLAPMQFVEMFVARNVEDS